MSVKADLLKTLIPTEAELCAIFMREFNEQPGWTCYPETAGFDIVVAHEDGRQIGVEAKLQLNAKVADQIMPGERSFAWRDEGPDHRLVIVRSITEANAGIAKLLRHLGVMVWAPRTCERPVLGKFCEYETGAEFNVREHLWKGEEAANPPERDEHGHHWLAWFDWNPVKRLALPELPPDVPAGVPAPVQMTPWKQAAIRVLARLRVQGYITAKEIVAEGCSPATWTQRWLERGPVRGQWIDAGRAPKLDQQYPELFALALSRARERAAQPFQLET